MSLLTIGLLPVIIFSLMFAVSCAAYDWKKENYVGLSFSVLYIVFAAGVLDDIRESYAKWAAYRAGQNAQSYGEITFILNKYHEDFDAGFKGK